MALEMNPKVFSGLIEEKLDDRGTEMFTDLIKLLLKADGDTTMQDVLQLLDEAKDNFNSNYDLIKTALEDN